MSAARPPTKRPSPASGPILNGPYDEPVWHYATAPNGSLDYRDRRKGRRIFAPDTPQVPIGSDPQAALHDLNELAANYREYLVNQLREQLARWRHDGYPGVTSRVTRDLLAHWFGNPERQSHHRLFFAQREAVEAAIWLNEVAERSNPGTHVLNQLRQAQASVGDAQITLPRIAFKMATGTGKTVVMACLVLYHYLNRSHYRNDPRYADYFLVVAPGITIRDRLSVLRVDTAASVEHEATDYYRQRKLVPPAYAPLLAGLNAQLVVTNFHGFEPRLIGGNKKSPLDGKLGPGGRKVEAREDEALILRRMLPGFKAGRRLVVLNDEAHHCYLPRAKGRDSDEEMSATENERAAVWYSGLRAVARRWQLRCVYDLSATPYYLAGSGWPAYSFFPWVVSDFSLIEAIEAGLVKIPFLPVDDSAQHIEEPILRNLYEHCRDGLPRKGQRTERKESRTGALDGSGRKPKADAAAHEAPPLLPPLLRSALEQFYRHYEQYDRGLRERGEVARDLLSAPPVFIVVCSNTTVSKEVYKLIAGYESIDAEGRPLVVPGVLPLFSNVDPVTREARQRPPTLLIDSDALEHSGQVDDEFKRVFAPEIEAFKRDYRVAHPERSVDGITDSWEQIAAKTFEQLPSVESYVKNAFLGFEVPYVDKAGAERRYQPDFLLRVNTPGDEPFNLIVEITGFAKEKVEKRWFVTERWLPAVNAQRQPLGLLPWHFIEVTDIERIREQLESGIERIAAEVDERADRDAWRRAQFQALRKVWDNAYDAHWGAA